MDPDIIQVSLLRFLCCVFFAVGPFFATTTTIILYCSTVSTSSAQQAKLCQEHPISSTALHWTSTLDHTTKPFPPACFLQNSTVTFLVDTAIATMMFEAGLDTAEHDRLGPPSRRLSSSVDGPLRGGRRRAPVALPESSAALVLGNFQGVVLLDMGTVKVRRVQ